MSTSFLTIDQLDMLATYGAVNEETAQVIQNLIDSVDGGDDEGCTWDWLGALNVQELKAAILEDDAEEPREWSATFDWDSVQWGRVSRYLPSICGQQ